MSPTLLLAFFAACVVLGLTPGPNMALIIANTTARGLAAGLVTLAGTTTGLAALVAVTAAGLSSVALLMAEWFDLVRWLGALYLVWLGAAQLRRWWQAGAAAGSGPQPPPIPSARSLYLQGLAVSLSNPKVLLFLGAFFPQFVDPTLDPALQLAVLATLFILTLLAVDLAYTFAIARLRARFAARHLRALDGVAGALLLAGGAALALARRP